jgi:hypothetical protein
MKTFIQYITELKVGKATRRLNSKNFDTSMVGFSDADKAMTRQNVRAMTASMFGDHEKAGAIGSTIDNINHSMLKRAYNSAPTKRRVHGEKYATGVAGKIEHYRNSVADRKRFNDRMSQQGPSFIPNWMDIDAIHRLDSGIDKSPSHEDSDLYGHIMRSQLANAAVRLGKRSSDVPAFVPRSYNPKL